MKSFKERLQTSGPDDFECLALELFDYQARENTVYRDYLRMTSLDKKQVRAVEDIPFLPISFFKFQVVKTGNWEEKLVFKSSGTTGSRASHHYIKDPEFYIRNSIGIFESKYGRLDNYIILALLPSYLERAHSSLVFMVDAMIRNTSSAESGFYLFDLENLHEMIIRLRKRTDRKVMLWGVTYALIDLAEKFPDDLSACIIMETGGMKGRREEKTREELHDFLKKSFNVKSIHSEYGMTELLSQAYSDDVGRFKMHHTMKILIREINDPFVIDNSLTQGAINIIDLANADSCAFIATDDLGRLLDENTFEVLGRMDNSDLRGCNFLLD